MPVNISQDEAAFMGLIDTYTKWKKNNSPPRKYEHFHPSSMGDCIRKMQYQLYAQKGIGGIKLVEKDVGSRMLRLFETGHHVQERWTRYFREMGILRGLWKCKNPLCHAYDDNGKLNNDLLEDFQKNPEAWLKKSRIYGTENKLGCTCPSKCSCGYTRFDYLETPVDSQELNIKGSADLIFDFDNLNIEQFNGTEKMFDPNNLPKGKWVADMKTINMNRFRQLKETGPSIKYQVQLVIYANILGCDGGLLIYEHKDDSDIIVFKIDKSEGIMWPIIKNQAKKMKKMNGELKDENNNPRFLLPPPKPFTKDDMTCKDCEFKECCHKSKIWEDKDLPLKRKDFYGMLLKK